MFYGSFFLNTKIEKSKPFSVFFLQPEIIHRQIQSKKFQGGIFLHPSIPRKLEDLLYTDKNADLIVIFCGTIYSFSNPVYQKFISSNIPNPELIACLFKKFGVQFFNSIIGDFAIAIIKPEKNELYLLRDHLGIYPLVYKSKNGIISFSTDPIGFCRTDLKESEKINLDPLLTHRKIIDTTQTYSKEVHKVLPGHYYYFNKNVFKKIKYWYPEKIKKDPSLTYYDSLNKLEILLSDAIKIRCDNRYYAGSHLSGGLDSSAIAVLTRKYYSNQKCFSGFSYSPEITYKKDFIFDERDFVKEICEKNQITPVFSNLTFSDYKSKFKSYIYNLGNFWEERILETAKEKKINLLFSGWGGDEFFSSSKGGLDVDLFYSLKWKKFFEINPIKKFRSFLGTLIYSILFPTFGIMKPWVSKSYKEDLIYFNKENRVFFKKSFNNYFRYTSWKKNKIGIIYNYHISERTEMWSIQGFRFGVEYRYPFLDYRFIELILQIPPENFFKDGFLRPFIRDLTKGVLPEKVRLNNTKLDEVFHSQFIDFFLKFFPELVLEIKSWKLNKDLGIVNFSLLEKELLTFSNNRYNSKDEALVRAVVFIKMLHEFTKTYRSLPQDSE